MQGIIYQVNSCNPIQQPFVLLRVHLYALIEQLAICAYVWMMYCIILIERSSIVNVSRVTESF